MEKLQELKESLGLFARARRTKSHFGACEGRPWAPTVVRGDACSSVRDFLIRFNQEYKVYIDSSESQVVVKDWIADSRIEIEDYVFTDPDDYPSWNGFLARDLKQARDSTYPSRLVTLPERAYVVVLPARYDCRRQLVAEKQASSRRICK